MSQTPETDVLPEDLLWASGGHASDIVLTALADGQGTIVPPLVRVHVERCPACMTHLGHAALLSIHAGSELGVRGEHDRVLARRPVPRVAVGLGLLVAFLGLVPSLFEDGGTEARLVEQAPLFLRGLGTLVHRLGDPGGALGIIVPYGTALLLVAMGFAAVRLLPKKESRS